MENDLKNKVVVVTGGAEGIGYVIADQFLAEGIKLALLLDINEKEGEKAAKSLSSKYGDRKAVFMKCNVTKDLEDISKKIFDTYKLVDVLVNNAGIVNESSPSKTMELNATAVIEWSMKFWEHMRKDKGGHGGTIVNIGSVYSFAVDPYLAFYKASKYAVMGFTRTLGHEDNFAKFGIRVIIICPGFTTTALTEKQLCWDEQLSDFQEFAEMQPWQTVDVVGKAAIDVFKRAKSGSAWKVIGGIVEEICLVAEGQGYLR